MPQLKGENVRKTDISGALDSSKSKEMYKPSGVGSCTVDNGTFSSSIKKSQCFNKVRQHYGSAVNKQTGATKSPHLCYKTWNL